MPLIKAQCTNCGGLLDVDQRESVIICPFCKTPYIVEKHHDLSDSLLQRCFICIQDGEFEKASDLLEQSLNSNPLNGRAYVAKLMIMHRVKDEALLAEEPKVPLSCFKEYHHAIEYADSALRERLLSYEQSIIDLNKKNIEKWIGYAEDRYQGDSIVAQKFIEEELKKDLVFHNDILTENDDLNNKLKEEERVYKEKSCLFTIICVLILLAILISGIGRFVFEGFKSVSFTLRNIGFMLLGIIVDIILYLFTALNYQAKLYHTKSQISKTVEIKNRNVRGIDATNEWIEKKTQLIKEYSDKIVLLEQNKDELVKLLLQRNRDEISISIIEETVKSISKS